MGRGRAAAYPEVGQLGDEASLAQIGEAHRQDLSVNDIVILTHCPTVDSQFFPGKLRINSRAVRKNVLNYSCCVRVRAIQTCYARDSYCMLLLFVFARRSGGAALQLRLRPARFRTAVGRGRVAAPLSARAIPRGGRAELRCSSVCGPRDSARRSGGAALQLRFRPV